MKRTIDLAEHIQRMIPNVDIVFKHTYSEKVGPGENIIKSF